MKKLDSLNTSNSFLDLKNEVEKKLWIKIYYWDYNQTDSENKWIIEIYKNNEFVWKIWWDLYSLSYYDFIDSHLWIKVEEKFQNKWFWKLLFYLYSKWTEKNKNIFIPKEEFAQTKSRVLFLLGIWYNLVWKYDYEFWDFKKLWENEITKVIQDAKKNTNWVFSNIYKFELLV